MKEELTSKIKEIAKEMLNQAGISDDVPSFTVVIPDDEAHGDYATNISMQLSRYLRKNPKIIAEELSQKIVEAFNNSISAEVAGVGFINFTISKEVFHKILTEIIDDKLFFTNNYGKGKKVLIEFVSANPTGPLHIGHGRGAAYGDSLARILSVSGYKVSREYYVNDAGNQMNNLALSVYSRIEEIKGIDTIFPENGYHGDYIKEIAETILKENSKILEIDKEKALEICLNKAVEVIKSTIEKDLKNFRVSFDNWFSEKSLYKSKAVEKTLKKLKDLGQTYEKDGALWLYTENKGDDKDRVLKKSSGEYTYFAPDIAYHLDKYKRGNDFLIDVWGADHHGYIKRMTCAIEALGYKAESFEASLVQMVNLIKDGKKVSMSTRSGSFIPMEWLINEVGTDAARFFYNMRSHDAQFDFDIDLAKAHSSDNPVYYIQYAHARVYSLIANAESKGHKFQRKSGIERLIDKSEINLIKDMIRLKYVIETSAIHLEPHRITYYLQELASSFHSYYYANQIISSDKDLTNARLTLCEAVAITIKYALDLLGVFAPERM